MKRKLRLNIHLTIHNALAIVSAYRASLTQSVQNVDQIVEQAIQKLGGTKALPAVQMLIDLMLTDKNPSVRRLAVDALGRRSHRTPKDTAAARRTSALCSVLINDTDWTVRQLAAHALGDIADPVSVPTLLASAITEREYSVRDAAFASLKRFVDHDILIARLSEALIAHQNLTQRAYISTHLAALRPTSKAAKAKMIDALRYKGD
jgi:HEAT repeat protein